MFHRYGRHGPRAWLRWRECHYVQRSRDLVYAARVAVIHVQVPMHAERIIIIVQHPEQFGEENEALLSDGDTDSLKSSESQSLQKVTGSHFVASFDVEQEIIKAYLPTLSETEREVAEGLYTIAKIDAPERAQKEIQRGFENPPSIQQLEMDAQQSARDLIRQQVVAGKRIEHVAALTQLFARLFRSIYDQEIRGYQDSGVLLNDEELHIRQTARQDKKEHEAQGTLLNPEHLRYFAVARAMKAFGLDTELSLSDLSHIDDYVKSYSSYYNQQSNNTSQEVERPYAPNNF